MNASSLTPSSFFFFPCSFFYLSSSLFCLAKALALAPPAASPPLSSFLSFLPFFPPAASASFGAAAPFYGAPHDARISGLNCPTSKYHAYAYGIFYGVGSTLAAAMSAKALQS